ncbi:MAG: hypothetical protein PWQ91_152 [Eubacteriales bacterium]|nr:hypothetical protein [Eubacteriales bacterium]
MRTLGRAVWMQVMVALTHRRWFLVPLLAVALVALGLADIGTGKWGLSPANQWDILLWVFNQPFLVVFLFPAVFSALVADFVSFEWESGWLFFTGGRISSRALWWWSKVGAVALLAVFFTGVMFFCVGIAGALATSWEWTWSQLVHLSGWDYPGGLAANSLSMPPPLVMVKIFLLLSTGLAALGTVVLAVSLFVRRAFAGWVIGALISLFSYAAWKLVYHPLFFLFPALHFLLAAHREFNASMPAIFTVHASLLGEIALFLVAAIAGHIIVLKRDL